MSRPVAEVIVETLVDAGVRHCYGIVGDTLNRIAREIDGATSSPHAPCLPGAAVTC